MIPLALSFATGGGKASGFAASVQLTQLGAAQLGADARDEFADAQRLCQVVIRADFDADDHVHFVVACEVHDDDRSCNPPVTQLTAQVHARRPGRRRLEQDHVRVDGVVGTECLAVSRIAVTARPSCSSPTVSARVWLSSSPTSRMRGHSVRSRSGAIALVTCALFGCLRRHDRCRAR